MTVDTAGLGYRKRCLNLHAYGDEKKSRFDESSGLAATEWFDGFLK